MSGNRLEKKVIEEIVRLFEAGLSNKQITEKKQNYFCTKST